MVTSDLWKYLFMLRRTCQHITYKQAVDHNPIRLWESNRWCERRLHLGQLVLAIWHAWLAAPSAQSHLHCHFRRPTFTNFIISIGVLQDEKEDKSTVFDSDIGMRMLFVADESGGVRTSTSIESYQKRSQGKRDRG